MADKFSLKWNDYQSNWNKALNELRKDTDLSDVTLISDDKVKFSAHKILLSSCSSLFKFILRSNTQAKPLLYLGGVDSVNLGFILDYIYHGEVNIFQEQVDSFLESAQKLEIHGLLGDNQKANIGKFNEDTGLNIAHIKSEDNELAEDKSLVQRDNAGQKMKRSDVTKLDVRSITSEDIDKKMRELYERTDEGWKCLACGHTSKGRTSSNIRQHVQTHLNGLVYKCSICNKQFSTSPLLNQHKGNYHKNQLINK